MAGRGMICCVPNCSNKSRDGISFYIFPKDVKLRKQWIASIAKASKTNKWTPSGTSLKVCGAHFKGGRKTNDHNIPTIFEKKEKPKAGKKNAENKDDQTKNDKKSNAIMEPFERKISVRLLARKLPIIPPPAPSPKPQPTKKPPARATQPKKAPGKAKTMNVARTRSARNQRATKVIVKPPSPPPEIKEEPEPIKVGSTALIRFIREDHLYCLPKADNPGSLQKLLEEKAKVVETLLEKIHSLELELEEKDLNLKRVQEELRKAQSIIAQQ